MKRYVVGACTFAVFAFASNSAHAEGVVAASFVTCPGTGWQLGQYVLTAACSEKDACIVGGGNGAITVGASGTHYCLDAAGVGLLQPYPVVVSGTAGPATCPASSKLQVDGLTQSQASCACDAGTAPTPAGQCQSPCQGQPNSTWDGTKCVCNPSYHLEGGVCTTCTTNSTWNGAVCACDAGYHMQANTCVPDCTAAVCNAACSTQPTPASFPAIGIDDDTGQFSCGSVFGGSGGVKLAGQAHFESRDASCGNGCTASAVTQAEVETTFRVCGGKGYGVKLSGSSSTSIRYGKKCDDSACQTVCDTSSSCRESAVDATLTGGAVWNLNLSAAKTANLESVASAVKQTKWGPDFKCEAVGNLSFGGTISTSDVAIGNGAAPDCKPCTSTTFGPVATAKLQGDCSVGWVGLSPVQVKAQLSGDYKQAITYTNSTCGTAKHCGTSQVSASVGVAGQACVGLLGRNVKLAAKASFGGTCTASSCDGTTSGCEWKPVVETAVAGLCKK